MAEAIEIKATARDRLGKGAAREARRQGRVPGVIYGDKAPPQGITVDYRELQHVSTRGNFLSSVCELDLDGKRIRVLPRELQVDPVRDYPIHVDFMRLVAGVRVSVDVPVRFLNDGASPGLKRGGVLNIVRHTVELYCPAEAIPELIEVDLTGLEIGNSVHISHVRLPDGCTPVIRNRDFTVATIAGRSADVEEGPTTAAAGIAAPGEATGEPAPAAAEAAPAKKGDDKKG